MCFMLRQMGKSVLYNSLKGRACTLTQGTVMAEAVWCSAAVCTADRTIPITAYVSSAAAAVVTFFCPIHLSHLKCQKYSTNILCI